MDTQSSLIVEPLTFDELRGKRTKYLADSGRKCLSCPTLLSIYNLSDQCERCRRQSLQKALLQNAS